MVFTLMLIALPWEVVHSEFDLPSSRRYSLTKKLVSHVWCERANVWTGQFAHNRGLYGVSQYMSKESACERADKLMREKGWYLL